MKSKRKNTQRTSAVCSRGPLRPPLLATGPRACLRTARVSGPCSKCSRPMEPVAHSPLHLAGLFCPACCPVCRETQLQPAGASGVARDGITLPPADGARLASAGAGGAASCKRSGEAA